MIARQMRSLLSHMQAELSNEVADALLFSTDPRPEWRGFSFVYFWFAYYFYFYGASPFCAARQVTPV